MLRAVFYVLSPLVFYAAVTRCPPRQGALLIVVWIALRALEPLLKATPAQRWDVLKLPAVGAAFAILAGLLNTSRLMLAIPAATQFSFAFLFARSLKEEQPLVERFARIQVPDLPPDEYTVMAEQQIRGDIEFIGTVSTFGILLLFLLLFRSPRMLVLGLVPLAIGSAVGTVATYAVFGRIHGLTLAFGTSLLGVGIDYAEHYFAHFALASAPSPASQGGQGTDSEPAGADAIMDDVWPGLRMGAWTTVVGFAGLAWADFPGAKQIALFASSSVFGALLATRYLLPAWMPQRYTRPGLLLAGERLALRLVVALRGKAPELVRRWGWAFAIVVVLAGAGFARLQPRDDVRALLALDPALVAEDTEIQGRIQATDPGRFAVVAATGSSPAETEAAIDRLSEAHNQLRSAVAAGELGGFVPLGALLHSERAQAGAQKAARDALPAFDHAAVAAGFQLSAFAPFRQSLDSPRRVTLQAIRTSPLAPWLSPLMPLGDGGKQLFVIPLKGVHSTETLQKLVPAATILDEGALLNHAYRHVRIRVIELLAAGMVLVLGTLYLRYRNLRVSLAAIAPAILAAIATVACLGWVHAPLTILNAVALSLVLSMGVDYGIFAVEGRGSPQDSARALVSIATATTTTLLSFGLLAASASPALASLGVTITLGMLFSLLFSPVTVLMLAEAPPTAPEGT